MAVSLKKDFAPFIMDDFLDTEDQQAMLTVLKTEIPWSFRPHSVDPAICNSIFPPDRHIFSSYLIRENQPLGHPSKLAEYIIFKFLEGTDHNVKYVLRAQANFDVPVNGESILRTPHTDVSLDDTIPERCKFISLIYYVNNADGNTVLFDKKSDTLIQLEEMPNVLKEVTPKQGQLLVFDSTYYHTNWTPVESEYRMVINIILMLDNFDE
jgi:hypothetical protein